MPVRPLALTLLATLLFTAAGCQRLNYKSSFKLEPLTVREVDFSAPAYEQRVTVTITPTNGAVSGYLIKSADKTAVGEALDREKDPAASLLLGSRVSKGGAETYSFDATVPAKTPYSLLLKADKKSTEVKVSVVGR